MGSARMPEKAAATALAVIKLPVTAAIKLGEADTGKAAYHRVPKVAPSGNEATAACCATTLASAGPSTMAPGVSRFRAATPVPRVIKVVVISAAAARVPV